MDYKQHNFNKFKCSSKLHLLYFDCRKIRKELNKVLKLHIVDFLENLSFSEKLNINAYYNFQLQNVRESLDNCSSSILQDTSQTMPQDICNLIIDFAYSVKNPFNNLNNWNSNHTINGGEIFNNFNFGIYINIVFCEYELYGEFKLLQWMENTFESFIDGCIGQLIIKMNNKRHIFHIHHCKMTQSIFLHKKYTI
jgi:hypothetical protein